MGPRLNKAFLTVGDRELLQRALHATRQFANTVLAVGDPGLHALALKRYGWEGRSGVFRRADRRLHVVVDETPGGGPLAGLVAGLAAAAEPLCWVLAVDLPFAIPEIGSILIEELEHESAGKLDTEAVVPEIGNRLQPLCAAYRRMTRRTAEEWLRHGDGSVHGFLNGLRVGRLPQERFRALGDPHTLFHNVNDPAQLAEARRIAASMDREGR